MDSAKITKISPCLTREKKAVLRILLYFDIFSYPLKKEEILNYSPLKMWFDELQLALDELLEEGLIFKFGDFYLLHNNPAVVRRRMKGNMLASKKLKVARKIAGLIGLFPYVRAVMLSGSISKGYMDKDSDIDFFIITVPGKLWIARTLLVLFKRIFLLNSHKYFCVNYFIDMDNLEIEEQNLFTAMECVTVVPVYGDSCYLDFWNANTWTSSYFPNVGMKRTDDVRKENFSLLKGILELLFSNRAGHRLDRFFMKMTHKRWETLFKKDFSKEDFEVAFKTKEYASKNHPRFYQKRILEQYSTKLREFENNFSLNLTMDVA